ncbi:NYN domain-containing protein [Konateibacter massiliensis]|uniref:NYN domain-containing protein n=1 Tax=Konateibacter massiliensis TaxID=2002841 RepID=UPI000C1452C4|nr:NYN domain-containing protein [Konateibacter massiliensis]
MDNLEKMVVLIDADNTRISKIEAVMRELSAYGRIIVKRAYGNWKKDTLKNWEAELKRLAIKAEQQFDYVKGKNATDIALAISAIDLLHSGIYDAFVLVASDSDYTPLALRLRESGVSVIGVGEKKTPEAFRNACDEFIFLENLTNTAGTSEITDTDKAVIELDAEVEEEYPQNTIATIDEIHSLLEIASEKYQEDDGFVNVSSVGAFLKRTKPDFDTRTYGHSKLSNLLEAYPDRYEIKKYRGKGNASIVAYKCL